MTEQRANAHHAAVAKLEPEAQALHLHIDLAAQVSTAISLKRIADFLAGTDQKMNAVTYLAETLMRYRIGRD